MSPHEGLQEGEGAPLKERGLIYLLPLKRGRLIREGLNRWFKACEKSCFFSLLTARVVSPGETYQLRRGAWWEGYFRRLDDLRYKVKWAGGCPWSKVLTLGLTLSLSLFFLEEIPESKQPFGRKISQQAQSNPKGVTFSTPSYMNVNPGYHGFEDDDMADDDGIS